MGVQNPGILINGEVELEERVDEAKVLQNIKPSKVLYLQYRPPS
jgi:hypothetical protein